MNKFSVLKVIRHMVNAALGTASTIGDRANQDILREILKVLVKHNINEN